MAIASDVSPAEVDWLLQEITDLDSLQLRLETFKGRSLISAQLSLSELEQLWQRRLQERVPIQYLVGVTPWRDFSLKVTPDVLIPRPETEFLIDLVAQIIQENPLLATGNWVDLGTGSGAIAIGLAKLLTKARIYAIDYSQTALKIAQENIKNQGLDHQIECYQGSWWQPLAMLKNQVTGMVCNPPYIPSDLVLELQPEVKNHEPHLALDGGEDGLDCVRYLIKTAPEYLHSGAVWLVEVMIGQSDQVITILEQQGSYCKIKVFPDLAGIDRFILAYRL
jgi:release factor glutamine methyltransferase